MPKVNRIEFCNDYGTEFERPNGEKAKKEFFVLFFAENNATSEAGKLLASGSIQGDVAIYPYTVESKIFGEDKDKTERMTEAKKLVGVDVPDVKLYKFDVKEITENANAIAVKFADDRTANIFRRAYIGSREECKATLIAQVRRRIADGNVTVVEAE